MRMLDRIFGWLMVAAALLHCYGSFPKYHADSILLLWSLGTGLAEIFLGAMNLVRAERRHDLVLARLCVFGNVAWIALLCTFAIVAHAFGNPVILGQILITVVLLGLSTRARNRSRPM
jgi:hypothetical protein